ncbi:sensor histidine kinase [Oceanobacillus alkalisoli]|uniref:sensor histidine kinase n=1 Tax=Oceanobacillus alkalisoli TaxID=2925113 RepID=UPI001F11FBB8|nr:HAMP domain-containing sensor histidine kinase [Oceanobacillus alkalisoli]MCF3944630.1 ATP-binding protein [Oceanobacillus alkalisoli]
MKLRTKIRLFSSILILSMLILVNTFVYFLFYKNATDSQLVELSLQTDNLIEQLASATAAEETSEVINAFLPANGMVKVFSSDEQALEFKLKGEAYRTLEGAFQTAESQEIIRPERGVHVAVVTKPIIWHDGSVVTLQMSDHLVALTDTLRILFYVLIIVSLIILIPTIIGSNILNRLLLNPIEELTRTMKTNIKERKWKKIDHSNRSKDELYEMEVTFNEMIDQLRDNYERQEDFVSNASHELKTPIQIVKSYAQLLERRGKDNPELLEESIAAIDSEADRMKRLVEQLLSLAKNKENVVHEPIELVQLVDHSITTFKQAYNREIEFHKNIEKLNVLGNAGQLEQIIYILIENALKYSEDKIAVSLFTYNGDVIYSVKDYGSGISPEDQERIFERFYRVDKARSRETGGSGLGLSIAKEIAESHHGKLTVESAAGEGSMFTLVLPAMKKADRENEK